MKNFGYAILVLIFSVVACAKGPNPETVVILGLLPETDPNVGSYYAEMTDPEMENQYGGWTASEVARSFGGACVTVGPSSKEIELNAQEGYRWVQNEADFCLVKE